MQARIQTLKGRCLLATGDIPGARDAFLRARVLDPHLLEPGLELRKLEARRVAMMHLFARPGGARSDQAQGNQVARRPHAE